MLEVIPSPGTDNRDWEVLRRRIEIARMFARTIHIDIVDDKFSSKASFLDPKPFTRYKDLFLELHMMVANPMALLDSFAQVGFDRFIAHVESFKNAQEQEEFVAKAQSLGEVGLAIDGPTPLSMISIPYEDLDCILVMTIKAGESGQSFTPKYLDKVVEIRQKNEFLPIEVDGGITDTTLSLARNAGANRFVSTTFIFNPHEDSGPQAQFNLLKKCLE